MREKMIEKKLVQAVKLSGWHRARSSCLPVSMGCLTASCFYRMVTLASVEVGSPRRKTASVAAIKAWAASAAPASRSFVLDDEQQIGGLLDENTRHMIIKPMLSAISRDIPSPLFCLIWGLGKTSITLTALNDLLFDSLRGTSHSGHRAPASSTRYMDCRSRKVGSPR